MKMIKSIEEYLDQLKAELNDSDAATIQDALADAEEHLRTALANLKQDQPERSDVEALGQVIEQYGSPDEIAPAYKEVERLTRPTLVRETQRSESILVRFFAIYADPRAWGSLLFMLIAFVTGIVYFTWAVTGLSLSISLAIFIFGLPFVILFLLSLRGLALLEGRIVEALLGVRMPRRPKFSYQGLKWLERLKLLVTDKNNWKMFLYMLFQLPFGTLYFSVFVILVSQSLSFMVSPILEAIFHQSVVGFIIGNVRYYLSTEWYPLVVILGFLMLTASMHLFKWIGQLHGKYAKMFLVTE
jgi:uncharacterized membrane protein